MSGAAPATRQSSRRSGRRFSKRARTASTSSCALSRFLRRAAGVRLVLLRELEARGGGDVVEQVLELLQVFFDVAEVAGGALRVAFAHQLERHADACQRRAQLVRHVGQELFFGLAQADRARPSRRARAKSPISSPPCEPLRAERSPAPKARVSAPNLSSDGAVMERASGIGSTASTNMAAASCAMPEPSGTSGAGYVTRGWRNGRPWASRSATAPRTGAELRAVPLQVRQLRRRKRWRRGRGAAGDHPAVGVEQRHFDARALLQISQLRRQSLQVVHAVQPCRAIQAVAGRAGTSTAGVMT